MRIRRILSIALSSVAIAGASTVLYLEFFVSGFVSFYSVPHPFHQFMRETIGTWAVLAIASLILLSGLPRPTRRCKRLPRVACVIALILSGLCLAVPTVFGWLAVGWILLIPIYLLLQ